MNKRNLLIGGVGVVKGNVPGLGLAMLAICDKLEPDLIERKWLADAPFETVSLIIRYGAESKSDVMFDRIDHKNKELPVAVLSELAELRELSRDPLKLEEKVEIIAREVIAEVCQRYELPNITT